MSSASDHLHSRRENTGRARSPTRLDVARESPRSGSSNVIPQGGKVNLEKASLCRHQGHLKITSRESEWTGKRPRGMALPKETKRKRASIHFFAVDLRPKQMIAGSYPSTEETYCSIWTHGEVPFHPALHEVIFTHTQNGTCLDGEGKNGANLLANVRWNVSQPTANRAPPSHCTCTINHCCRSLTGHFLLRFSDNVLNPCDPGARSPPGSRSVAAST